MSLIAPIFLGQNFEAHKDTNTGNPNFGHWELCISFIKIRFAYLKLSLGVYISHKGKTSLNFEIHTMNKDV